MASQNSFTSLPEGALFNRVRMGYAVIESRRLDAWQKLLGDCLGMQAEKVGASNLRCRMDERRCRFLMRNGGAEDLAALGMELMDEQAHRTVMQRLQAEGIAVEKIEGEEAELRGVARFWRFRGPKKLSIEIYFEPLEAAAPPKLTVSGFVTGDQGFGHAAFVTRQPERTLAFWKRVFDIRYSDELHQSISGVPLDFVFLRFNRRHHSIALASTPKIRLNPIRTQPQHIEVQAASLNDIGTVYRRCKEMKFPIAMGVGQHANDKAVSFYVRTPSGFDIEYGWNPIAVEEDSWHPEVWDRISIWGHYPESLTVLERAGQLGRALASLARKEFVPGPSAKR